MFAPRQLIARTFAHPRLTAPVLGLIGACGFEPLHVWPLTLVAIAGLIALIVRAPGWRQAALIGWLWGVGHFCLGNNWIATAFTYQAAMPVWLGWIAVFLLSLFLAIYPAMAAAAAWRFRGHVPALVYAFAGIWTVSEWLRSWLFSGFAWNPLGIVLLGGFDGQGLAMLARWTGTYGLSGVVVLLGGGVWAAITQWSNRRGKALSLAVLCALMPMLIAGRIAPPQGSLPYTLIQPGIAQQDIDNPAKFEEQFVRTARLTTPLVPGQRRLVLWPESGIPDYLREGYPRYFYEENTYRADPRAARARIARVVGANSALLTGTVDLDIRGEQVMGARNVVSVIDDLGAIRASYAKAHLVPYGEYLPMREVLEPMGLSRLVPGSIDFQPGPGPRTLNLGRWGRAAIQICYEIVFSGQVVDRAHRPSYIFNPSNDGWFGAWGPPQHLAQARLRAIEEGLPVLRATTNGISAVIDADGIVRASLPRMIAGRLDGTVPPAHLPTLFAQLGNMLPLGQAAVLLVLSLVAMRRRQG